MVLLMSKSSSQRVDPLKNLEVLHRPWGKKKSIFNLKPREKLKEPKVLPKAVEEAKKAQFGMTQISFLAIMMKENQIKQWISNSKELTNHISSSKLSKKLRNNTILLSTKVEINNPG